MRKLKVSGKYETFEEIQDRMQREVEDVLDDDQPEELIIVGDDKQRDEARQKAAEKRKKKLKEASELR